MSRQFPKYRSAALEIFKHQLKIVKLRFMAAERHQDQGHYDAFEVDRARLQDAWTLCAGVGIGPQGPTDPNRLNDTVRQAYFDARADLAAEFKTINTVSKMDAVRTFSREVLKKEYRIPDAISRRGTRGVKVFAESWLAIDQAVSSGKSVFQNTRLDDVNGLKGKSSEDIQTELKKLRVALNEAERKLPQLLRLPQEASQEIPINDSPTVGNPDGRMRFNAGAKSRDDNNEGIVTDAEPLNIPAASLTHRLERNAFGHSIAQPHLPVVGPGIDIPPVASPAHVALKRSHDVDEPKYSLPPRKIQKLGSPRQPLQTAPKELKAMHAAKGASYRAVLMRPSHDDKPGTLQTARLVGDVQNVRVTMQATEKAAAHLPSVDASMRVQMSRRPQITPPDGRTRAPRGDCNTL